MLSFSKLVFSAEAPHTKEDKPSVVDIGGRETDTTTSVLQYHNEKNPFLAYTGRLAAMHIRVDFPISVDGIDARSDLIRNAAKQRRCGRDYSKFGK